MRIADSEPLFVPSVHLEAAERQSVVFNSVVERVAQDLGIPVFGTVRVIPLGMWVATEVAGFTDHERKIAILPAAGQDPSPLHAPDASWKDRGLPPDQAAAIALHEIAHLLAGNRGPMHGLAFHRAANYLSLLFFEWPASGDLRNWPDHRHPFLRRLGSLLPLSPPRTDITRHSDDRYSIHIAKWPELFGEPA